MIDSFHRPGQARRVPGSRIDTLSRLAGALMLVAPLLGTALLGGCSVTMPMQSMMPQGSDDVTGSLGTVPFGQLLDEEDRRREKAALATALDPQGDGSTIRWENAKSGHKGAITAKGHAYPDDAKICRAFTGTIESESGKRVAEGIACTLRGEEWSMIRLKDEKKV